MRHFALALFAAFNVLAIVKLTSKNVVGDVGCQALGKSLTDIIRYMKIQIQLEIK